MISEDFVHEAMERTQMAPWTFGAQLTDLDELLESERRFDYQFLNGAEYVPPFSNNEFTIDAQQPSTPDALRKETVKDSTLNTENFPKPNPVGPRKLRKRLGLPLTVFTNTQEESIIACPDTGADNNIISWQITDQLGLPVFDIPETEPSTFVLANGRTVSAIGQVHLKCAFRQGCPAAALIDCSFYVFQTLAVPMIIGVEFLHATETLTKHRDRLVEELVPSPRAFRIRSVDRPKRNVICRVGNYVGCLTADTGSDLDLVSLDFAASGAFDVMDSCVELEFADGSTGYTMGIINTVFSIGSVSDVEGYIPRSKEVSLELFVLDNLNADVLACTDTLQDLQAFSGHTDCFMPTMSRLGESDLNIIRSIGTVEKRLSRAWEFLKDSLTSSGDKQAAATSMSPRLLIRIQNSFISADGIFRAGSQAEAVATA